MHDEDLKEYILCKNIYHCTPKELDEQEANKLDLHYSIYTIEQEAKNKLNKQNGSK